MLTAENIYQSIGEKILFDHISFSIKEADRIGLIGVNGTGKSSLLKALANLEKPEAGIIDHPKDYQIEYLAQEPELDPDLTVLEQIYYGDSDVMRVMRGYEQALQRLAKDAENEKAQERLLSMQQQMDEYDAWEASTLAKTVLTQLGITAFDRYTNELSGGQKKRVAIAKALIQPADLLILDEPTNHLDNETIEWLEKFLAGFKGALLLVTHDRYFLNRVTNRIFELDKGTLYTYDGNYELFLEKKAEREALEQSQEQKHQNTLKREIAWLKRGVKARGTKQKARIERVEEMKKQTFHTSKQEVAFQAGSTRLGKKVIELEDVGKAYDNKPVLGDFSYLVVPGERLGIIGPNGSGKTTLLNIMAARVEPDTGTVEIGETVNTGYYTQEEEELDNNMRIITYIKEVAEVIHTRDGEVITAEQMLERFLFSRREQWTYIGRLSGGEKRRLYLLKVLMTEPNVLLLDEPTNDLDTQTLSVLEEYLEQFPGVVITVSHDRYFLDRVVDHLLVFNEDGEVDRYNGNYSEYLEQTAEERQKKQDQQKESRNQDGDKDSNKSVKKKLSYMEQREWETIEDDIAELEATQSDLERQIAEAGSDFDQVQELYQEQQQIEEKLEAKIERWAELSEKAD